MYKLPTASWINLANVEEITPYFKNSDPEKLDKLHNAGVAIIMKNGRRHDVPQVNMDAAEDLADDLAEKVISVQNGTGAFQ